MGGKSMKIIYWLRLIGLTAIRRFDGLGSTGSNFHTGFGTALNLKPDNEKKASKSLEKNGVSKRCIIIVVRRVGMPVDRAATHQMNARLIPGAAVLLDFLQLTK